MRKYFKLNDKENTRYQSYLDTAKAMFIRIIGLYINIRNKNIYKSREKTN